MPSAVDALGVVARAFHFGVHGVFVGEVPLLDPVHGHAADADGALFAHDGDAAFQVVGVGEDGDVDAADGAAAEFEAHSDGVLGLDPPAQGGREREDLLDGPSHPLDHVHVVGRLVAQGSAVELPGAPPGGHVVVVLGAGPEDVGGDHVEPSEAPRLKGPAEEDDGGVEAVLFDLQVVDLGFVAGGDGLVDGLEARAEGLFGEDVPSRPGGHDSVFGVEARRGAEGDEVAVRFLEHLGVA